MVDLLREIKAIKTDVQRLIRVEKPKQYDDSALIRAMDANKSELLAMALKLDERVTRLELMIKAITDLFSATIDQNGLILPDNVLLDID